MRLDLTLYHSPRTPSNSREIVTKYLSKMGLLMIDGDWTHWSWDCPDDIDPNKLASSLHFYHIAHYAKLNRLRYGFNFEGGPTISIEYTH